MPEGTPKQIYRQLERQVALERKPRQRAMEAVTRKVAARLKNSKSTTRKILTAVKHGG